VAKKTEREYENVSRIMLFWVDDEQPSFKEVKKLSYLKDVSFRPVRDKALHELPTTYRMFQN
jgi:hypothetical protein